MSEAELHIYLVVYIIENEKRLYFSLLNLH